MWLLPILIGRRLLEIAEYLVRLPLAIVWYLPGVRDHQLLAHLRAGLRSFQGLQTDIWSWPLEAPFEKELE